MERFSVVAANFNNSSKGFLHKFLETLSANILSLDRRNLDARIVIVDDGSTDDSLEVLMKFKDQHLGQVDVLHTPNVDVTGALNKGMQHVLEEYKECSKIVTLDIDTCLSENFLQEMMGRAKVSTRKIGMLASNQFLLSSRPTRSVHRSTGHYVSSSGATLDKDFLDRPSSRGKVILCPCFSGGLFKTEMLVDIGLVSEKYVHYNNCSELGFRAQLSGWKVEFAKLAVMWHYYRPQSQISDEQKNNREISRIWNVLRFFPQKRVETALETYKNEVFQTSPERKRKELYIKQAKVSCPEVHPGIPDDKKEELFKQYITSNS